MKVSEYLGDRLWQILAHIVSMAALTAFLYGTGTAPGVLALTLIAWTAALAVYLTIRYLRERACLAELEAIMNSLDKKYLLVECAPKPRGLYERRFFDLMRRGAKAMTEAVSQTERSRREYREYIENWVHEIKAPIAAAKLVCRHHGEESSRKVAVLMEQIEEHVERALYRARADGVEKDFIVRETDIADIVRDAVAKHRTLLIHAGVRVEADEAKGMAYTDGKWASFMLGQLLSNAIRYRRESPVICLISRQDEGRFHLTVRDNGMGIPPDDLPRVFERGFTGANGRAFGTPTGMGLYIVAKLAGHLQVGLEAASVPGEYTEIRLTFPAKLILIPIRKAVSSTRILGLWQGAGGKRIRQIR
jgi:signal transduction histidine kinase